ncbi:hypothetical protein GIB67_014582 [Kingdonia uniflora]|uniref:Uncharacterized protein n=1 Tax=Kingdonia uniflora TaxID=39325 RepID=A0A7J7MNY4_9MAGN|nr:hypothetical protein GIB67_014582 [Kingdonia uniflora]
MSLIAEEIRSKAEVFQGPEICREMVKKMLAETNLPNGLIPLDNIEECGHVKESGFVWFKRKEKKDYRFKSTGKLVSYAPEITGYVDKNRIKKLTGIKSQELAIWVSVKEVYVPDTPNGKITFKAPLGLFKTYPVSMFEIDDVGEIADEVTVLEQEKETKKD